MIPDSKKLERKLSRFIPYRLARRGDIFWAENESMKFAFAVSPKPEKWGSIEFRPDESGREVAVEIISPEAVALWDRIKKKPGPKPS